MIKLRVLRHIVVLIVISVLFPVTLQAQLELPPSIHPDVPRESQADFNSRRDVLLGQFNELALRIKDHNARCGNVPGSNMALVEECQSAFIQLRGEIASYSTRVKAFEIAVEQAVQDSKAKTKNILTGLKDEPEPSADDLAHALTSKALLAGMRGDDEAAIGYYRAALKHKPNDRGIQLALGHALYIRDKDKKLKTSLKTEFVLDALQQGQGNWEASIIYLKDALEKETDKEKALAVREALGYVKGLYAYQQYQEAKEQEELTAELEELMNEILGSSPGAASLYLREGFKQLETGDFDAAISSFKSAQDFGGNSFGIRDIHSYAEGLRDARQKAEESK